MAVHRPYGHVCSQSITNPMTTTPTPITASPTINIHPLPSDALPTNKHKAGSPKNASSSFGPQGMLLFFGELHHLQMDMAA